LGFGAGYHVEALLKVGTKRVKVIEPRAEVLLKAISVRDLTLCLSKLDGLAIGEDGLNCFADDTELVIRPQTQLVAGELCGSLRGAAYGARGFAALSPSIAVLGPLQGGTLPMTHYVARSLAEMKARLKVWDVSGFAQGYHHLEDFLTDRTRKSSMQSNYVEMLSQMVLESASEKPIDILICMAQAPISGRVLEELRKKGVITVLWFVEDYKRFGYWREMSRYYDFVFTIQRGECLTKIQEAGAGFTHYLPPGCDPMVHTPVSLSADERARWGSPVSFLGAGYHNRQQVFASLTNLPFKIWGTEWPTCKPFDRMVQEQGRRLSPGEYVKIFAATDINLNLHSSSERDGVDPFGDFVNPRTFELAAAGAFQLVDQRSLLPELFDTDKELVTFANAAQMREQIAYFMDKPAERKKFAEAARARALKDHTYTQRIKEMLRVIYTQKFEHLKNRQEASGWGKLLARSERHSELKTRCAKAFERGEEPILDGLVADVVSGEGTMTDTERKLMFLYHIRKQIIRMRAEEAGENK
jgi:spore maturation protein CgeB